MPRFEKVKTSSFRLCNPSELDLKPTFIKLSTNESHEDLDLSIQLIRKERFQRIQSLESVHLSVKDVKHSTTTIKLIL